MQLVTVWDCKNFTVLSSLLRRLNHLEYCIVHANVAKFPYI